MGKKVFFGGRLIDGKGNCIENSAVVIDGETIIAVGEKDKIHLPADAEKIDISGKTIMPGLIDAHFACNWYKKA